MTKLQKIREEKGMNIYRLSKISGVNITTISNIEKGKASTLRMRYGTLKKLADAMHVSVEEIVDED